MELDLIDLMNGGNAVDLVRGFENYVNSFSFRPEKFVDELKKADYDSQYKFTLLSLGWISELDFLYREEMYDGRNEYSVKLGYDINRELQGLYEIDDFSKEFAYEMRLTHRTLMQSFSSIVFLWLRDLNDTDLTEFYDVGNIILENFDENYYKTPFI